VVVIFIEVYKTPERGSAKCRKDTEKTKLARDVDEIKVSFLCSQYFLKKNSKHFFCVSTRL